MLWKSRSKLKSDRYECRSAPVQEKDLPGGNFVTKRRDLTVNAIFYMCRRTFGESTPYLAKWAVAGVQGALGGRQRQSGWLLLWPAR
jgi:hypothetical protein